MRFMLACFGGDRAISVDAQKTLEVSSREHKSGTCSGSLHPDSSAIILYALKKNTASNSYKGTEPWRQRRHRGLRAIGPKTRQGKSPPSDAVEP